MTRVGILRAGYAALGVSFVCLAATTVFPPLLILGLAVAFLGAVLLAWSGDDLPKWAGLALAAYLGVLVLTFLFASTITLRPRGLAYYVEFPAPDLARAIFQYLQVAVPIMLAGAAVTAAWERERPARVLLLGGAGGFIVVAILTVALEPRGANAAQVAADAAAQGGLLLVLVGLSALCAAGGSLWAAARPEEVA